jgi:hypothetical protein
MDLPSDLSSLATSHNAHAWFESPEKWVFCAELLETIDCRSIDSRVEELESLFECIIQRDNEDVGLSPDQEFQD